MNPSYDFTGQVALVTGASSGMGLATARAFAEAGASVVLADINQSALTSITNDLADAGHQVLGVRCDVAEEDQVAALMATTVDTFGRLDMAFNNAGIQLPVCDAADEPAEAFDRVTAINLRGVWACMKHELAQMRTQGSGAIVNCSSLGGLVGNPGRAAYHATTPPRRMPTGSSAPRSTLASTSSTLPMCTATCRSSTGPAPRPPRIVNPPS